jgi:hypothetical protein
MSMWHHSVVGRTKNERKAAAHEEPAPTVGAEMFDSARTLVLASLPKGLAPEEARRRLCERFYGQEIARRVFGSRH